MLPVQALLGAGFCLLLSPSHQVTESTKDAKIWKHFLPDFYVNCFELDSLPEREWDPKLGLCIWVCNKNENYAKCRSYKRHCKRCDPIIDTWPKNNN